MCYKNSALFNKFMLTNILRQLFKEFTKEMLSWNYNSNICETHNYTIFYVKVTTFKYLNNALKTFVNIFLDNEKVTQKDVLLGVIAFCTSVAQKCVFHANIVRIEFLCLHKSCSYGS